MKKKGLIIALFAVAAVVAVVVFILLKRKKNTTGAAIIDKQTDAAIEVDEQPAPVQSSPSITAGNVASIASNIANVFNGNGGVSYDANERSITVNGQKYQFPSREKVKEVQRNLIEGFEGLAKNNSNLGDKAKYLGLVQAMKVATRDKTGIDGVIGKATAAAFAKAAELMPSVVQTFKVN